MTAPRIVMLDDSKTVLATCKRALSDAGYDVVTATGPEQLDERVLRGASMILVDVNMPEVFGEDVVRILRAEYLITAPIYLYSTISEDEGAPRARAAGADGFLRKHDPQTLVRDVKGLVDGSHADRDGETTWMRSLVGSLTAALLGHADKVDVLVTSGQTMDPRVLRHSLVMELHGAAGEAALLGHSIGRELIGDLEARLVDPMVFVPEVCWGQLASWFRRVCTLTAAQARGDQRAHERQELEQERQELLRALVQTNTPTFRPCAPEVVDEDLAATGRRILVIDDSAVVRTLLASTLGDLGYPVATARNMDEASTQLYAFSPELVITDVSLPGVEGDEICRRIKAGSHRLMPVIFYSGLPRAELAKRATASGADAFVNKEEGYDALIRSVRELFRDVVLY